MTANALLSTLTTLQVPIRQLTLHSRTIKTLQKALLAGKDPLGLTLDLRPGFPLAIHPDVALDVLTLLPPIVCEVGKTSDAFTLIARLWQFDFIEALQQHCPDQSLAVQLCLTPSSDVLARLYSAAEFAGRCQAMSSDTEAQTWQIAKLHQAFQNRPTDALLAQFLGKSIAGFQGQRKTQNDARRRQKTLESSKAP